MRPKRVRLLVWWQFPRALGVEGPAGPGGRRASWESCSSTKIHKECTHDAQSPVCRVHADPGSPGRPGPCSRRGLPPSAPGPGRTGLVEVRGRRRDRRGAPRRARRSAPTGATASASRRWPPPPGRSSWRSPSFAPDRSSPPCSTRAGGWTRPRCAVICSARSRGGLHPQGLATWCGPWATSPGSAAPRSQGSARTSTRASRSSSPGRWIAPGSPTCSPGATYLDVRVGHRVVCRALVVATGVSAEGRREILGMALGDAETVDFWTSFLRSLRERGLKVPSPEDPTGVVLVTSDAHAGIRAAVRAILPGASWQRCRAPLRPQHHLPAGLGPLQAGGRPRLDHLRPDQSGGRGGPVQARHRRLEGPVPFRIAQMLIDAEPDLTAFAALPREHWTKIRPQQPHRAAQPGDQAPSRRRPGSSPTASPHAP